MSTYYPKAPALMALAVLILACESDPTGAKPGGFLRASLSTESATATPTINIQHRGGAEWGSGTGSETHRKLEIHSKDANTDRHLYLNRLSSAPEGPFQPGVHSLVPRDFSAGDNDGYTAKYVDFVTGNHYIAESGTWTITEVSEDDEVTGHFDFVATYWCNVYTDRAPCPLSPKGVGFRSDAVRLRVHGEFRAEKMGPVVNAG